MRVKIGVMIIIVLMTFSLLIPFTQGYHYYGDSRIEILAYPSKTAYLSNEEIQVSYLVYGKNGEPLYGGDGHWVFTYFYNNTLICKGNFTLPTGLIGIFPSQYHLHTDRYMLLITYTYGNFTTSREIDLFVVDYTEFYYQLNILPLTDNYLKLVIDDNVEYQIGGIFYNIPVPTLKVDYISIYAKGGLIENASSPFFLDSYGRGEYYFRIPTNVTRIRIVTSVANKVLNITYTPRQAMSFYFSTHSKELLAGGYLNLTVKSMHSENESFNYHFEIRDSQGNLLFYAHGNHSSLIYRIPEDFSGILAVRCDIYNSTQKIYTLQSNFHVKYAILNLYFDRLNYTPQSRFTVAVDFKSYVIKNVTFVYNVMAYMGLGYATLFTKTTKDKTLEVEVPKDAPESYRIEVYAISPHFVMEAGEEIHLLKEIGLKVKMLTQSSYVTHVFTPGQKVVIRYSLSESVNEGRLLYGFGDEFYAHPNVIMLGKERDGTVSIEIPKNIDTGIYVIHFTLLYDGGRVDRELLIYVDKNPSWTFYSILGMPLGYFLLILIFVVVLALLILLKISEKGLQRERERKKRDSGKRREEIPKS